MPFKSDKQRKAVMAALARLRRFAKSEATNQYGRGGYGDGVDYAVGQQWHQEVKKFVKQGKMKEAKLLFERMQGDPYENISVRSMQRLAKKLGTKRPLWGRHTAAERIRKDKPKSWY